MCLSVTRLRPANMAEQIEVLFGMEALGGARNIVLDGGPDPSTEMCSKMIRCGRRKITLAPISS